MLTLRRSSLERRIDEAVDDFERALVHDRQIDVRELLPGGRSPDDCRVAGELLCVDMVHRWQRGDRKTVRQYDQEFADLLQDPRVIHDLAREEFRLRIQDGETVSPDDYRRQYHFDTSSWPRCEAGGRDTLAGTATEDTGIDALGGELQRLTEAIATMPAAGDHFAEFELVEELGRGAFSVVYLARQSPLEGRPVVLKITTASPLEAAFLAKLQHTNIVPIYSLHRSRELQAICMPYFGRQTLATRLAACSPDNGPPIQQRRAVQIARQIACGLQHAHGRGIVHRDLKPANVLLADDGTAMILDFNLSDDAVAGGKSCLMVGGTLPYLAPEHLAAIRDGRHVGIQSDIYSLGVILYQLLCTRLPFPHRQASFDAALSMMINDRQTTPAVRVQNPNVSPGLAAIVDKLLAPQLAQRYQSMVQVVDDLQRYLDDRPLRFAADRSWTERIAKWSRRHPRISSASSILAASTLVLMLLVAAYVSRGRRIAQQDAVAQWRAAQEQLPAVRALTSVLSSADRQTLEEGAALARKLVDDYGVLNSTAWRNNAAVSYLDKTEQEKLEAGLVQSLYGLAAANLRMAAAENDAPRRRAQCESALRANRVAVAIGPSADALASLHNQHARILQIRSSGMKGPAGDAAELDALGSDSATSYFSASRLLESGRYEDALRQLDEIRRRDPYDVSNWFLLGQACGAVGRWEDADACFSACIALWPDSYLGYFHRGRCRLDAQKYPEAAADFDEALARNKDYIPAFINRAVCQRELGNFEAAEADLTRALERHGDQTRIYFLRAEVRRHLGDPRGAAADVELGMRLTPNDELSWIARGLAQLREHPDRALADFKMAIQLNPRSYAAWRNIAHLYAERLNRPEDALAAINKLLELPRPVLADRVSRGVLFARLGNRDGALQDARQVMRRSPGAKELFQVACIYSLTSQPDNDDVRIALAILERAVAIEPQWLGMALKDPDLAKLRQLADFEHTVAQWRERIPRERLIRQELEVAP